jgi:hypothetical protein
MNRKNLYTDNIEKILRGVVLCISFFLLAGQGCKAQMPYCPPECYPLDSGEVARIFEDSQSPLYDGQFKWVVDKVGQGFICLDTCTPGQYAVSEGVFHADKCIYKITNAAQADSIGTTTCIVLRRIPEETSAKPRCFSMAKPY